MSFPAIRWAFTHPIPTIEKMVLLSLANHANEDWECWPSMSTIAAETSMCRRSVLRAIPKLVERGLISLKSRMTAHGKSSHIYTLNMTIKTAKTPCDSQSHLDVTRSHIMVVTHSHIEPEPNIGSLPF